MILGNQSLNSRTIYVIIWRELGRSLSGKETNVQLRASTSAKIDLCHPCVVVESRRLFEGFAVGIVACGTSICAVVVKLDPEDIELGAGDGGAHVRLIQGTLRGTRDDVVLRARVRSLVLCEQFSKSRDAGNVTELLIRARLLDVEIKTVEVDVLAGIGVVVSTVERSDTGPGFIVRSVSTPQEFSQVNTIRRSIQIVVAGRTSERKQDLLVGVLLTVVQITLKIRALLVQEVVTGVVHSIITWSRVVSIPTLITKGLSHQPVRLRWENVDETNRNDIDVRLVTEVR